VRLHVMRMPPVFAAQGQMTVAFNPEDATLFADEVDSSRAIREIPAEAGIR
jgi:hypothetical protein